MFNFFTAVKAMYWDTIDQEKTLPYIVKTVGIQALFGVLKIILTVRLSIDADGSVPYFSEFLAPSSKVKTL